MGVSFNVKPFAQAGLVSKGIVYCLLGVITFLAAFRIKGGSTGEADKSGVFDFILEQTGGQIMLGIIALGLISYFLWRAVQAFADTEDKGSDAKGLATRGRYLFSGLVYGSLAFSIIKILFFNDNGSGDEQQDMAQELLSKPFGQWLAGIGAAIFAVVGGYQVYYGLSEKYRKHAEKISGDNGKKVMLGAGKIGYVARGIVWLLIAWLFLRAAMTANSAEAGDTSEAFGFLQDVAYGKYLLAAMGAGLFCYGTFNFIRARYEKFNS
jgi:hypothetical protein